jgi:hypothetical protein
MYTAWGHDLPALLHDSELHRRLADAGVRRLQLNLDDADVAPAMRIPTAEPIGAIVSVWTDDSDDPDAMTAALRPAVDRLAGWAVDERLPIPPPDGPSGERMNCLANVAVLRRPHGLTREEWLHRWLVDHTPVAIATQATFGYVQNVVARPVTEDAPRVDAFVEELFPSAAMTDMHAFYGSDGDDAALTDRLTRLMASVSRFGADRELDLVPTSRYFYELG